MTTTEIMKSPGVSRVLFVYTFTMLLALAYTASKFALSWELPASQNYFPCIWPRKITDSASSISRANFLFYQRRVGRLRLQWIPDRNVPRNWWLGSSYMAPFRFPVAAMAHRYRRRSTTLCLSVAGVVCCNSSRQLSATTWSGYSILDFCSIFAGGRKWCRHGFQYVFSTNHS